MVESFFCSLKVKSIHGVPLVHSDARRQVLSDYTKVEYSRTLRNSALGYTSPDVLETRIAM